MLVQTKQIKYFVDKAKCIFDNFLIIEIHNKTNIGEKANCSICCIYKKTNKSPNKRTFTV